MELKSGFLSLENFKAALSSIQRQPKQECIKGLPIWNFFGTCFLLRCTLSGGLWMDSFIIIRCSWNSSAISYLVSWLLTLPNHHPHILYPAMHHVWYASIPFMRYWSTFRFWNLFKFT
jgi:hypothetical protein